MGEEWKAKVPAFSEEFRRAYEVLRPLGEGGMGTVYLARQVGLGREVALKVLKGLSPQDVLRFAREGKVLAGLRHAGILTVFDAGADGEVPYLVCEYVEGETLRDLVARERLTLRRSLALVKDLAAALACAHDQGIVHRDVKPENVFMLRDGPMKLGDFGLARDQQQGASLTEAGMLVGTPAYMAPEQLKGARIGPAVDQYALGVLAFELITGTLPFAGATPMAGALERLDRAAPPLRQRCPAVPEEAGAIVDRMLAREEADRFDGLAAVVAALEDALTGLGEVGERAQRVVGRVTRRTGPTAVAGVEATQPMNTQAGPAPAAEAPRRRGTPVRTAYLRPAEAAPESSAGRRGVVAGAVVVALVIATVALWRRGPVDAAVAGGGSAAHLRPRLSTKGLPGWLAELRLDGQDSRFTRLRQWSPLGAYDEQVGLGARPADVAAEMKRACGPILTMLRREAADSAQTADTLPSVNRWVELYEAVARLRLVDHLCRLNRVEPFGAAAVLPAFLAPGAIPTFDAVRLGETNRGIVGVAGPGAKGSLDVAFGLGGLAARCQGLVLNLKAREALAPEELVWVKMELVGEPSVNLLMDATCATGADRRVLQHAIAPAFVRGSRRLTLRVERPGAGGRDVAFEGCWVLGRYDVTVKPDTPAFALEGCWKLEIDEPWLARLTSEGPGKASGPLIAPESGTVRAWEYQKRIVFRIDRDDRASDGTRRPRIVEVVRAQTFEIDAKGKPVVKPAGEKLQGEWLGSGQCGIKVKAFATRLADAACGGAR